MTPPRLALALLTACLLPPAGALLAQDRGPSGRSDPPLRVAEDLPRAEVAPPGSLRPVALRDPFRGSPALEGPGPRGAPEGSLHPQQVGAQPLQLRLLGLLRVKDRAPGALLELGAERSVVRAGDRLHVQRGPFPAVVQVLEVSGSSVRLLIDGEEREVR